MVNEGVKSALHLQRTQQWHIAIFRVDIAPFQYVLFRLLRLKCHLPCSRAPKPAKQTAASGWSRVPHSSCGYIIRLCSVSLSGANVLPKKTMYFNNNILWWSCRHCKLVCASCCISSDQFKPMPHQKVAKTIVMLVRTDPFIIVFPRAWEKITN